MMLKILTLLGQTIDDVKNFYKESEITTPVGKSLGEPRYINLTDMGVSLVLNDDDLVSTIQFYSDGYSRKYQKYTGEIYEGIDFSCSRGAVRAIMGEPHRSEEGGLGKGLFGGYLKPWDIFIIDGYKYHFEYSEGLDNIGLVSVSVLT